MFLDRDGTLVVDVPHSVDPQKIRLTPGAAAGLRLLRQAGYALFVATNQPGIAQGRFTVDALDRYHERLGALLADEGLHLDGITVCPHDPAGTVAEFSYDCFCRKPRPGLLVQAAREHTLNLRGSWMVGDILHDVEAGHAAGCRTILLHTSNETEWTLSPARNPDHVAFTLEQAARIILAHDGALPARSDRRLKRGIRPLDA